MTGVAVFLESVTTRAANGRGGLDRVSLALPAGETWVAFGRHRSGTSELLRVIVGDAHVESGRVEVLGVDLTRARARPLLELRRRIGFVFRQTGLLSNMTLEENVSLPVRYHLRHRKGDIGRRVEPLLDLFGLREVRGYRPADVDALTARRAAFARALTLDPDILLADYPLEGLDPVGSARLLEIMGLVAARPGRLFIIATCELDIYAGLGGQFIMLEEGQVLWAGSRAELATADHPAVRQFRERSTDGPLASF
jgi:phospholipid/cholesterol/gamma-HCH transport system ATP-binding protein